MADSPSLEIGNSNDFGETRAQVHRLVRAIAPGHDMSHIDHVFSLAEVSSRGMLLGYSGLLTPYHDHGHMLEVVLCSARLLHGLHLGGRTLDGLTIDASIVGALLHDAGYLMASGEASGSGAQFTQTHVARGVVFAERNLADALPEALLRAAGKVIRATDHRPAAAMPEFDNPAQRLAAQVAATADLIGQMASREYLERLLLLYLEFREAGLDFFADIHDLFERTGSFYALMEARLRGELGDLTPYLGRHFEQERGVGRNFYAESLTRNLDYLERLVKEARPRRLACLRRGGIVDKAMEMLDSESDLLA